MVASDKYGSMPNAGVTIDNRGRSKTEGILAFNNLLVHPNKGLFYYAKILVGIISLLYIVIAIARIIAAGGDDSAIQKNRASLLYAVLGFVVVMLGDKVPEVFTLTDRGTFLADHRVTIAKFQETTYGPITVFVNNALSTVAIFFMVVSGWNMISAQGQDDKYKKNKTRLVVSVLAFAINILAETIVFEFLNKGYETGNPELEGGKGIEIISHFVNFLLTLSGTISVAFLILGGFYYIINIHEEKHAEKGKQIVVSTVIALMLIFSAKVIVNFAIGQEAPKKGSFVDVKV